MMMTIIVNIKDIALQKSTAAFHQTSAVQQINLTKREQWLAFCLLVFVNLINPHTLMWRLLH